MLAKKLNAIIYYGRYRTNNKNQANDWPMAGGLENSHTVIDAPQNLRHLVFDISLIVRRTPMMDLDKYQATVGDTVYYQHTSCNLDHSFIRVSKSPTKGVGISRLWRLVIWLVTWRNDLSIDTAAKPRFCTWASSMLFFSFVKRESLAIRSCKVVMITNLSCG